jgi:phosphate transport system substrate-binding protein
MRRSLRLMIALLSWAIPLPVMAQEISGSGSTFVYPIMAQWSAAYGKQTSTHVGYQPIGSSRGIAELKAGSVDFSVSDAPLAPAELAQAGLVQFPVAIGGIVPVVNLKGVELSDLRFTGSLLANIYLSKIKRWSDPAIAALNPTIKFPDIPILVMHRSDGSGTTFNWTDYLSKVSEEWSAKVGRGNLVSWPAGFGSAGNKGVAEAVIRNMGAIGYVDYAYALQRKMDYGIVQNHAGNFIQPDGTSFEEAAESADWSTTNDFDLLVTDAPGAKAYPITATSFALLYRQPKDTARSRESLAFFEWTLLSGQEMAASLGYVPLPAALIQRIQSYWQSRIR